jgi:translation initiation factor IF-3
LSSWKQRSSTIPRTTTLYANVITNSNNNSIIISSSSSSTTALWSPLQRRYKNTSAKNNNSGGTLANERLVARLVKLKRASHASQIRVRVVPNPLQQKQRQRLEEQQSTTASKHDKQELGETPTSQPSVDAVSAAAAPAADNDNTVNVDNTTTATTTTASTTTPTTAVVTLQEAIQQALEAQLDLVEISLDQEIPVVTIARLSALVYHGKVAASGGKRNSTGSATGKSSAKSSATSNSNSNSSNATASATANSSASQQVKEITLMVGIAEHDLRRKLADVRKFVERGHTCTVTVRASRKDLRDNAAAASDGVDRIVASLTSTTSSVPTSTSSTTVLVPLELVKAPTLNEQKTMGQFQVRASKRKS